LTLYLFYWTTLQISCFQWLDKIIYSNSASFLSYFMRKSAEAIQIFSFLFSTRRFMMNLRVIIELRPSLLDVHPTISCIFSAIISRRDYRHRRSLYIWTNSAHFCTFWTKSFIRRAFLTRYQCSVVSESKWDYWFVFYEVGFRRSDIPYPT
jgi:hypothetical protein